MPIYVTDPGYDNKDEKTEEKQLSCFSLLQFVILGSFIEEGMQIFHSESPRILLQTVQLL